MATRAEANLGGTLQLRVDLEYLDRAFAPLSVRGQHDVIVAAAREATMKQALEIAAGDAGNAWDEQPDPLAGGALEAWLASVEVCPSERQHVGVCKRCCFLLPVDALSAPFGWAKNFEP